MKNYSSCWQVKSVLIEDENVLENCSGWPGDWWDRRQSIHQPLRISKIISKPCVKFDHTKLSYSPEDLRKIVNACYLLHSSSATFKLSCSYQWRRRRWPHSLLITKCAWGEPWTRKINQSVFSQENNTSNQYFILFYSVQNYFDNEKKYTYEQNFFKARLYFENC